MRRETFPMRRHDTGVEFREIKERVEQALQRAGRAVDEFQQTLGFARQATFAQGGDQQGQRV